MGLDTVELLLAIEEEFDLDIPNEEAEALTTAGDISSYVLNRLIARGEQPNPGETWERVKSLISYQLGVKPDKVTPDAHIVDDLGAD